MFIEVIDQRVRLVRSRSFAGLMTLYESNYVRLRQLLGNLLQLQPILVSVSPIDLSIHVTLEQCSRYTSSLRMTYRLELDGEIAVDPDLLLRIYHDAHLVEAVSCCVRPRHAVFRRLQSTAASELERRWSLNILLNKWLEYCLDHGHTFAWPKVF